MQKKRGRTAHEKPRSRDLGRAALHRKRLPKKTIRIKLQLPGQSYEMLSRYVERFLNTTLEKKLQDVLICWIDKAISYSIELEI